MGRGGRGNRSGKCRQRYVKNVFIKGRHKGFPPSISLPPPFFPNKPMVSVDIKHNVYSGWPPIHGTQTLARVSKALAKHISCRWPTENSRPRSPTSDPRPPRRWTTVARWQRSSRAHNSASERALVGSRFKRTEPLKRNGSWGMMAKRDLQTVSNKATWCFMPMQSAITVISSGRDPQTELP